MTHWVLRLKGSKPHCCGMFQPRAPAASTLMTGRSSRP